MKLRQRIFAFLILSCCIGVAVETKAQAVTGYTSIDYYESTDTLDAYSETDLDFYLADYYDPYVLLRIVDENGNYVASRSATDTWGSGLISVEIVVSGTTRGTTYTDTGYHRAIAALRDYSYHYPYQWFYYDNYNFTYFENRGIDAPWYYYFLSPGFQEIHRTTAPIRLGSTHDSASVSTPGGDVVFKTAKIYQGAQGTFELVAGHQSTMVNATASQCNPSSNFTLTVDYTPPNDTNQIYQVTAKGFGNSSVANWYVDPATINKNDNLSASPPTGTVSMTVNNKNGGQTGSGPYDSVQITVKGIYNSGQSFSTLASVHIQCP